MYLDQNHPCLGRHAGTACNHACEEWGTLKREIVFPKTAASPPPPYGQLRHHLDAYAIVQSWWCTRSALDQVTGAPSLIAATL